MSLSMTLTTIKRHLRMTVACTAVVAAATAATPGVAYAAAGCDLGDIGREGIAPHGTQVSIGGKVFICNNGDWSML